MGATAVIGSANSGRSTPSWRRIQSPEETDGHRRAGTCSDAGGGTVRNGFYRPPTRGTILVDKGARKALEIDGRSLLFSGSVESRAFRRAIRSGSPPRITTVAQGL
jgi:hypothetical protein